MLEWWLRYGLFAMTLLAVGFIVAMFELACWISVGHSFITELYLAGRRLIIMVLEGWVIALKKADGDYGNTPDDPTLLDDEKDGAPN